MKYYIVPKENEYALFRVSNELTEDFEKEYQPKVIAHGGSILEALAKFELAEKIPEMVLDTTLRKFKN